MPEFPFGVFSSSNDSAARGSWLARVRENLGQLLIGCGPSAASANGAPLHLVKLEKSAHPGRAQGASVAMHIAVIAALVLITVYPHKRSATELSEHPAWGPLAAPPQLLLRKLTTSAGNDGQGKGSNNGPDVARVGEMLPISSVQLVRPLLPDKQQHELPVPPTILDASAPPILTAVDPGVPWADKDTNSLGKEKGEGVGNRLGNRVGDSDRDGPGGEGTGPNLYRPGMTSPSCAYCPDPKYTDEAREQKLQGKVTLQVLVSADGRAERIRLVQGLGLGLDERAIEAVQHWRFIPAKDATHHPVASWITIEAAYRLF